MVLLIVLFLLIITPASATDLKRIELDTHLSLSKQIREANTTYVVKDNFRLTGIGSSGAFRMPEGCTLEFEGGCLSFGEIIGNETRIKANRTQIFGDELVLSGTWDVDAACVEWFGARSSSKPLAQSNSESLQRALDSPFPVLCFGNGYYYVDKSIVLTQVKTIQMTGNESLPLEPKRTVEYKIQPCFGTVLWTDKDINLLEVRIKGLGKTLYDTHTCHIEGGTIDVSSCRNYSRSAIAFYKVKDNNSNVYPYLRTTILGPFERDNISSTGVGISFIEESNDGLGAFYGGVISCYINGFHTAVKHDFSQKWITNIEYNCAIDNSCHAYDFGTVGNCGGVVDGWVQTICMFEENDDEAVIVGNLQDLTIAAKIWDLNIKSGSFIQRPWTNRWVAKLEKATETPTIAGRCIDSYDYFKNSGLALMKIPSFEPDPVVQRSKHTLKYIRYIDNSLLGFSGINVNTEGCNYTGSLVDDKCVFTQCVDDAKVRISIYEFANAIGWPSLIILSFDDYQELNFFQDCHILSYRTDGSIEDEMIRHFDGNPKYMEHAILTYSPPIPWMVSRIEIELSHPNKPNGKDCYYRLEGKFVEGVRYRQTGRMLLSTENNRPQMVTTGFQVYDQTIEKPIYNQKSGQWRDANGYTPAINRGPLIRKPNNLLEEDAGFLYFDTEGKRFIYWDGRFWKNLLDDTVIK